jgi:hypothetical protein
MEVMIGCCLASGKGSFRKGASLHPNPSHPKRNDRRVGDFSSIFAFSISHWKNRLFVNGILTTIRRRTTTLPEKPP